MRHGGFIPLLGGLVLGLGAAPAAEHARTWRVSLEGRDLGEVRLVVGEAPDGTRVQHLSSHLASTRDASEVRRLEERVVSRDGRFVSGWARVEVGGTLTATEAVWVDGAIEVRRGDEVARLPLPAGDAAPGTPTAGDAAPGTLPAGDGAPWTLLDAARDLARRGTPGERRLVFDPSSATLGEVVLRQRLPGGWVVLDELGVRVRSQWLGDDPLPRVLILETVGLTYRAVDGAVDGEAGTGVASGGGVGRGGTSGAASGGREGVVGTVGTTGAASLDPTGRPVRVVGRLRPGARIRLEPAEAFQGVDCRDGVGRLGSHGPICRVLDDRTVAVPPPAGGPHIRALADSRPPDLSPPARAAWLAAEVARRLSGPPAGAGLWEATPEQALATGAGDCNEAAAVFMAAAPLVGLDARRRTGLVLDEDDPALLWPHAWVEVRLSGGWVRVDPERGEAPARGLYVDLGDGDSLAARMRPVAAAMASGRVRVLDDD